MLSTVAGRTDPRGGRFGPLSEPNFRFLYISRALSLLGDALVPVALAFAVLQVDDSPSALGMVLAARTASLVVCLLFGGVIADRLSRKRVLIASDLIRLVAQGISAALVLTGSATVPQLVVLAILFGIGWALFLPTSTGFVPQTVSEPRLQQANALTAATFSASQILGPVGAGVLVVSVGPGWALGVDAATFLISAIFVGRIRVDEQVERRQASYITDLREGWREFTSRRWLWVDGVYSGITAFAVLPALFALGPIVADRSLDGARSWATILTAFGIGSVLGGVVLLKARPRRPLLVGVPPLMLLAAPLLLLAISDATIAIAAGALAGGFGLTLFNTLFETTVQQHVPPAALSRVASIDWMLSQGLQPAGYALVGPAAVAFGVDAPLVGAALWVIATTLVVLSVRDVRILSRREVSGPRERAVVEAPASEKAHSGSEPQPPPNGT
jgi:MFS family permease